VALVLVCRSPASVQQESRRASGMGVQLPTEYVVSTTYRVPSMVLYILYTGVEEGDLWSIVSRFDCGYSRSWGVDLDSGEMYTGQSVGMSWGLGRPISAIKGMIGWRGARSVWTCSICEKRVCMIRRTGGRIGSSDCSVGWW
jgi:hypothetical protein